MANKITAKGLAGLGLVGLLSLASPSRADNILVDIYSDNIPGSEMIVKHKSGSLLGYDTGDHKWSDAPSNPNPQWIRISTSPYVEALDKDSRAYDLSVLNGGALSPFNIILDPMNYNSIGGSFTADNAKFQFQFVSGPDVERPDYNYSIVSGTFTQSGSVLDRINNHGSYTGSFPYDSSIGATLTLTPTPEPGTLAFLAAGLGVTGLGRKLRRRAELAREETDRL